MKNNLEDSQADNSAENLASSQNNNGFWFTALVSFLIGALVFGIGVFVWQNSKLRQMKDSKNKQIQALQSEMDTLRNGVDDLENKLDENKDQDNSSSNNGALENWKTYRNEKYGYKFKYPAGWSYSETVPQPQDFGVKVEFTSSDQKEVMTLQSPMPEIGYEAWNEESGEKILVPESKYSLTKRVMKARNDSELTQELGDFVLVTWQRGSWEESGQISCSIDMEELDSIISSFRFID